MLSYIALQMFSTTERHWALLYIPLVNAGSIALANYIDYDFDHLMVEVDGIKKYKYKVATA